MSAKRYSEDQIVKVLQEIDNGASIGGITQVLGLIYA